MSSYRRGLADRAAIARPAGVASAQPGLCARTEAWRAAGQRGQTVSRACAPGARERPCGDVR